MKSSVIFCPQCKAQSTLWENVPESFSQSNPLEAIPFHVNCMHYRLHVSPRPPLQRMLSLPKHISQLCLSDTTRTMPHTGKNKEETTNRRTDSGRPRQSESILDHAISPEGPATIKQQKDKAIEAKPTTGKHDSSTEDNSVKNNTFSDILGKLPWPLIVAIIAVIFALIAFQMLSIATTDRNVMSDNEKMIQKVNELFSKLKADFPNQNVDTWKKLQAAVKAIFRNTTTQPSVVILFANVGAEVTTTKFSRLVATEIESLFENKFTYIHEQGKLIRNENGGKLKEHFETVATQGFNDGSHVFLLENLNLIPGESVMMFHGLCDDQVAPFKKVVYLMTVDIVDLDYVSRVGVVDVNSVNIAKVWAKDIKIDQRGSLESRIGGIKVLIQPEDK